MCVFGRDILKLPHIYVLYICIPEKEELAGGDSRGWVFTGAGETRET
jgi:hypothetical protein